MSVQGVHVELLPMRPGYGAPDWVNDGREFVEYHKRWAAGALAAQGGLHRQAVLLVRRHPKTGLTLQRPHVALVLRQQGTTDEAFTRGVLLAAKRGDAFAQVVAGEAWIRAPFEGASRTEALSLSYQHQHLGKGIAIAPIIREGASVRVGEWMDQLADGVFQIEGALADVLPAGDN